MGGPPAKVRGIARTLVGRGHEVTVLTADRSKTDSGNEIFTRNNGWHRVESTWGWQAEDEGVRAIYLRTLNNYRATTINPKVVDYCAKELRNFDVIHIYGLYDVIGSVTAWFCRRYKIPYVLEPLGMFGSKLRSRGKKAFYKTLVGNSLFAGATSIIATSETERAELIEGGIEDEKIVIRRNGINMDEFQDLPNRGAFRQAHGIDHNKPLALFIGRLSFIKGLDLLVKAFAELDKDMHLIIAGPDDADGCADLIDRLLDQLQLRERVTVIGPVYGADKIQALVDADFVVLPSRYESFGNIAAEAIACGTPVLVTNQCGIAPLITDAGLVVDCDVESLRDGIKRLVEDPKLLTSLRAGCAAVARDLSWEEPVASMLSIYESLKTVQSLKSRVQSPSLPLDEHV